MVDTAPVFAWTDSLAIDNGVIDVQHKGLVRIINDLQQAMSTGTGAQQLERALDGLTHYVRVHFATEEAVMEDSGYPLRETHRADHLRLKQAVLRFREEHLKGAIGLAVETLGFLRDWIPSHIVARDRDFWIYEQEARRRRSQAEVR